MQILAVDDESLALEGLTGAIRQAVPDADIHAFRTADAALRDAEEFPPDVAFLDIALRGESGISLAKRLKERNPKINVIFVTGYDDYMKEAFDLHASGYVMKPTEPDDIREELLNLRFPESERKRLTVRTFGTFEVFAGGVPVTFAHSRTMELLAVLVDANGSLVPVPKLVDILWEGDDTQTNRSYLRNLLTDLRRTLAGIGASDVLVSVRGAVGVDRNKIDCDYFDARDRKDGALDLFDEEYMSQYSWAETTLGALLSGRI